MSEHKRRPWTGDEHAHMVALLREGKTIQQIADTIGRAHGSVASRSSATDSQGQYHGSMAFQPWTDDDRILTPLRDARRETPPEDINDDPHSAPSKRILTVWPDYQKTFHGPLIACDIGLDVIRAACPHFSAWLRRLEALLVCSGTP